jgi:CBS domain-containing protein
MKMKVRDIMSAPVHIIASDEPISRARNLMLKHNLSRLVVIKKPIHDEKSLDKSEEMPIGIVTKTDLSQRIEQAGPEWRRRPIDNIPVNVIMTPDIITIYPDATITQAAELILDNNISGLPVIRNESDKSLIGILTKHDIIQYFSTLEDSRTVDDIMDNFFLTVHRHHTISHVIREMNSNEVDRVIIVDHGHHPVGIITRTNIAMSRMINAHGEYLSKDIKMARKDRSGGEKMFRYVREVSIVAEDIMSEPIITLGAASNAVQAAKIMSDNQVKGIPIVNDKIKGIVTARNILQAVISQK